MKVVAWFAVALMLGAGGLLSLIATFQS